MNVNVSLPVLQAPMQFTHPLRPDLPGAYQDGTGINLRELYRLFPMPDKPAPLEQLRLLFVPTGLLTSELTGDPIFFFPCFSHRINYYSLTGEQLEYWYRLFGADQMRDVIPRLFNHPTYNFRGTQQYDHDTSIARLNISLNQMRQRYRASIRGGLIPGFQTDRLYFSRALFTDDGALIPMENLLFGTQHPIDLITMTFRDNTGREHPLFTPTEIPQDVRTVLEGRKLGVVPPRLADLYAKHPHVYGYREELHPLWARRSQEARSLRTSGLSNSNSNTAMVSQPAATPAGPSRMRKAEISEDSEDPTPAAKKSIPPPITSNRPATYEDFFQALHDGTLFQPASRLTEHTTPDLTPASHSGSNQVPQQPSGGMTSNNCPMRATAGADPHIRDTSSSHVQDEEEATPQKNEFSA
ncbi:hypothetical protein EJ08DRAFT_656321 [Tothia fuscella]|uniref:Uncharacterized protein n=1 Tax=Tothia fuscella TaxID=1048955 RepID=A0A9P4P1M7_9PEZI|nr:hypothetical protein EJ08DRAFT_656321 [Tothia fuscella]